MTQGQTRADGRVITLSTAVLTGLLVGNAWPVMAAASSETMTVVGEAATKTETPSIETPQSVSRVDRAEMDARGVNTLGEAVEYTPGVFANQVGASNRYDYLVMRGFSDGSLSNTFLDGLKVMGDTNGYSSMVIDPWFLERVDIVKGPASVLYGRSSPGGLVALTSKKPLFEARNALRVRAGNNATRSMAFDFSGPLGDERRVAYRLVGLGSARDTQFGPVEEKRYAFAPSLTWDVTDDTSVTFMAYLQKDPEGGYHSGVPYDGAVTSHNGRHIDNTFFDGEDTFDGFERTQRMVGYSLTHYVSDAVIARQKFRYLDSDVDMDQVYGYGWVSPDSTTLQRFYSGARESLQAWTLDNQLEMRFEHADVEHTLLLGLDYQTRANDVVWRSGSFPALDAFNPSYGAQPLGDFTVTNRERHELSQTGVYVQDQIAYGSWHATVGGRLDQVEIENKDRLGGNDSTLDETEFSGRAGLLYRFDNGLAPYASYNTAFTPTSFVDESGDLLEPMTGTQWEGGLKFRPPGTSDLYTASLFRITQENVATKEQPSDPYRAVGEIRSQGVELEADVALTPRLSLKAGYSYTDITYSKSDDKREEGNHAVYAPKHQASAWGMYTLSDVDNVNVGLGVRYFGGIEADRANTKRVPDYTLVDATFGAGLGALGLNDASIRINVANLLDKSYVAACNSLSYCYFGAERSLTATVDYQF